MLAGLSQNEKNNLSLTNARDYEYLKKVIQLFFSSLPKLNLIQYIEQHLFSYQINSNYLILDRFGL
jgi:hypothetical protein